MLWAALERTESRGTHYRSDYPTPDDARWQRNLTAPPARLL
jgi:L-aspartate oxidase